MCALCTQFMYIMQYICIVLEHGKYCNLYTSCLWGMVKQEKCITGFTISTHPAWLFDKGYFIPYGYCFQSMRNLVCRRSMTGKTCLQLVGILGLPVTMTRNFCQILLYIQ